MIQRGKTSSQDIQMNICGELVNRHRNMLDIINSRILEFNKLDSHLPDSESHISDGSTIKGLKKRKKKRLTRDSLVKESNDDSSKNDESDTYGDSFGIDSENESLGLIDRSLGDSVGLENDLSGRFGRSDISNDGIQSGENDSKQDEENGRKKSFTSLLKKRKKSKGSKGVKGKKKKKKIRLSEIATFVPAAPKGSENENKKGKRKKKGNFVVNYAAGRKGGRRNRSGGEPETPGVDDLVDQLQYMYNLEPGQKLRGRNHKRKKRKKRDSVNLQIESVRKDLEYLKKVKERNDLRILLIHQQIQEKQTEKQLILEKDELTEADRKILEELEDFIEDHKDSLFRLVKENEGIEAQMKEHINRFEELIQMKSRRLKMKYIVKSFGGSDERELDILKKELDVIKSSMKFSTYPYEMYELFLKDSFYKI